MGETITVYTARSPDGISLSGDLSTLDDISFTRVQDITTYTKGKQLYTFAIGEEKYEVVLGTISGTTANFDNTMTIEAEDEALFNSMSSFVSSVALIGTEETALTDDIVITNVKNFNTEGDKIVF